MKERNEMRKVLVEMKIAERVSKGKVESLIASINVLFGQRETLIDSRMTEM